jgi:hypothetical protein
MRARITVTALALSTVVGIAFALPRTQPQGSAPASSGPVAAGMDSAHLDLADGLRAQAIVLTTHPVLDPESGASVVPVAAIIEVEFNGIQVFQGNVLKLVPVATANALGTSCYGVSGANVQPSLADTLPGRNYLLEVRPKPGKTWAEVRNEADVVLAAQPR